MSFEFRGISEKPIIQKSQGLLKDGGGGGNLGYFQGNRKKKEENKNIFEEEHDICEFSLNISEEALNKLAQEEEQDAASFISKVGTYFKKMF